MMSDEPEEIPEFDVSLITDDESNKIKSIYITRNWGTSGITTPYKTVYANREIE